MKKLFIIANWKSYKTSTEAEDWLQALNHLQVTSNKAEKEIIVCPSFTSLSKVKQLIVASQMSIVVGSQDVSPFEEGAYTGEVNAKQVGEFAEYSIIGHSERRKHFFEDEQMLDKKVSQALTNNLTPIFCVQNEETAIPQGIKLVAYEPVFAIGSGHPDTPESADRVAGAIKAKNNIPFVLYGGSVIADNVRTFTQMEHIDGVLVGGASLDAEKFAGIIKNA